MLQLIANRFVPCRCTLFWALLFLSSPAVATSATSAEIEEWVQAHNTYRALHGVPPVTWSTTVAASAQSYADSCPSAHSHSMYGENLAWATYNMRVSQVVKMWYDEEVDYDYDQPGFDSATGHFTQVVWKGTAEIGCGFATNCGQNWPNMENAWVCQYNPPGNYIGQFANNVFPPDTHGDEEESPHTSEGNIVPILSFLLF